MKFGLIASFVICTFVSFAQQDPLYSQYIFNPLLINPAYAGINNNIDALIGYRTQWSGFAGQPVTFYSSVHSSFANNKVGAGISLVKDHLGTLENSESNISFAYKIQSNEKIFSFGIQTGFQNYKIDFSDLNIFDPDDNAFMGIERGTKLNIGAGAIFEGDKYFIGFSIPKLFPSSFKNGSQEFELFNRHFYLMGAYVIYLTDRFKLKTTSLLKAVAKAPTNIDFVVQLNMDGVHNAGLFTRNLSTYGAILQTTIKNRFRIGYTFEVPTNKSVGSPFNTHEIGLGIYWAAFTYHESTLNNF